MGVILGSSNTELHASLRSLRVQSGQQLRFLPRELRHSRHLQNGIFHNSRYGIFHLHMEGGKLKVELTSKGLNTNKFRKATVKSEDQAVEKIKAWMNAIIG